MTPEQVDSCLQTLFQNGQVTHPSEDTWQVEIEQVRVLVILSPDLQWLRLLVPVVPQPEAEPFLGELLELNFDHTQHLSYALYQNVLWITFRHAMVTLIERDFKLAIARALELHQEGLNHCFELFTSRKTEEIAIAAKRQGQTLESTLQNLTRLYQEGVMGGLGQTEEERDRFLAAWKGKLEQVWDTID